MTGCPSRARKATRGTEGSEDRPDRPDLRSKESMGLLPPCTCLDHRGRGALTETKEKKVSALRITKISKVNRARPDQEANQEKTEKRGIGERRASSESVEPVGKRGQRATEDHPDMELESLVPLDPKAPQVCRERKVF